MSFEKKTWIIDNEIEETYRYFCSEYKVYSEYFESLKTVIRKNEGIINQQKSG